MTCKEAQQLIMPYINDEMTDKELAPFLQHIYDCKACYEELEVYYTLYAGLAQLDGKSEASDMRNILPEALHVSELRVRGRIIWNWCYGVTQVLAILALTAVVVVEILRL